jgi:hypothetical protein
MGATFAEAERISYRNVGDVPPDHPTGPLLVEVLVVG